MRVKLNPGESVQFLVASVYGDPEDTKKVIFGGRTALDTDATFLMSAETAERQLKRLSLTYQSIQGQSMIFSKTPGPSPNYINVDFAATKAAAAASAGVTLPPARVAHVAPPPAPPRAQPPAPVLPFDLPAADENPFPPQETGAPPAGPTTLLEARAYLEGLPKTILTMAAYQIAWDMACALATKDFGLDRTHEATAAQTACLVIAMKDAGCLR